MFRAIITAFLLAVLVVLPACGGAKDTKADETKSEPSKETPSITQTFATSTNDQDYFSPFFGITVEKPTDWYAMSAVEFARAMGMGTRLVAGENRELQVILNASEKQSANIFAFYENEIGAPVDLNANIMALAENVVFAPGVKTGKDYYVHMKRMVSQSQMEVTYTDVDAPRLIDGVSFDRLDSQTIMMGQTVLQEYYATRRDQHILAFILTYNTEEQRDQLRAVLDTVSFEE